MAWIGPSLFVLFSFCVVVTEGCPVTDDGYLRTLDDNCFAFKVNENATYEQAEEDCLKDGGHLAMAKSVKISQFLQHQLTNVFNVSNHVWIGLSRTENESVSGVVPTYIWNDDKPADDVVGPLLNSILVYGDIMHRISKNGEYIQKDKGKGNPYVCQYDVRSKGSVQKISTLPTPTPTTRDSNTTTGGNGTTIPDKKGITGSQSIKVIIQTKIISVTKTVTSTVTKVTTVKIQPTSTSSADSSSMPPQQETASTTTLGEIDSSMSSQMPGTNGLTNSTENSSTNETMYLSTVAGEKIISPTLGEIDSSMSSQLPGTNDLSNSTENSSPTNETMYLSTVAGEIIISPTSSSTFNLDSQLLPIVDSSEETINHTSISDDELATSQIDNIIESTTVPELNSEDEEKIDSTINSLTETDFESQMITQMPEVASSASDTVEDWSSRVDETTPSQSDFMMSQINNATIPPPSSGLPPTPHLSTVTPASTTRHIVTTPTTTHVTPKDPCPRFGAHQTNMFLFRDKCYYFQLDESAPFQRASAICRRHGGYLASIKTKDAQTFIEKRLSEILSPGDIGLMWIGAHQDAARSDDKYYWMDGEEVVYNNFHVDSPKRKVAALLSSTGSWMPLIRAFPCNFICEFDSLIKKPDVPQPSSRSPSGNLTGDHNSAVTSSYNDDTSVMLPGDYDSSVATSSNDYPSQIMESDEYTQAIEPSRSEPFSQDTLALSQDTLATSELELQMTSDVMSSPINVEPDSPTLVLPISTSEIQLEEVSTLTYLSSSATSPLFTTDMPSTLPNNITVSTVTSEPTTTAAVLKDPCYQFQDKCYYFHLQDKMTFQKAHEFCHKYGGSLVLIQNKHTQAFIESTLHKTLHVKSFFLLWIGLQRASQQKKVSYYWTDGEEMKYSNFQTTPYHYHVVLMSTNGKWVDIEKSYKGNFICEFDSIIVTTPNVMSSESFVNHGVSSSELTLKPENGTRITSLDGYSSFVSSSIITSDIAPQTTTPNTPSVVSTPEPFDKPCYQYQDKCFFFQLQETATFQTATEFCQRYAGSLALIKNKDTQSFIERTLHETLHVKSFRLMWIGLRSKGGKHYWMDGDSASYTNLFNAASEKDTFVLLSPSGKWVDISKTSRFFYICEFNSTATTPKVPPRVTVVPTTRTTVAFDKTCYPFENKCFHFQLEDKMSFQQANGYCQKYGGSLVTIKNEKTQLFIEHILHQTLGKVSYSLSWIGLQKDSDKNDGQFYWMNGELADYTNFFASLSDNNNFALMSKTGKWFDVEKSFKCYTICDFDSLHTTPIVSAAKGIPTLHQSSGTLNKEWCSTAYNSKDNTVIYKNNKCLYFEMDQKLSFTKAQEFCKQRGGSLVLVKSEGFQKFIVKHIQEAFNQPPQRFILMWIGLRRNSNGRGNSYSWLDNSSPTYKNFRYPFPSGQYVSMASNAGSWFTQDATSENNFICESVPLANAQN